jgi:hypothetical protein
MIHMTFLPRTVILMILVICAGGTILMENPQNSLVAMQSRFVWLVKLLERAKIPVPCPYAVLYIS